MTQASTGVDASAVFRTAEAVVFRTTGNGLTMAFDRAKGVMYELNETASSVLQLVDGCRRLEQIAAALAEEYEVASDELWRDIEEIVLRFDRVGLLEHVSDGVAK